MSVKSHTILGVAVVVAAIFAIIGASVLDAQQPTTQETIDNQTEWQNYEADSSQITIDSEGFIYLTNAERNNTNGGGGS